MARVRLTNGDRLFLIQLYREVTYYRWRQEFGGLKIEQVKRLKDLELENSRLRKAYGITSEQWEALFESQGRRCAICSCRRRPRQSRLV